MKKTLILAVMLLSVVSSCDFVRTLAGRPTSARLEEMREERMRAEEARASRQQDIACVYLTDFVDILTDVMRQSGITLGNLLRLRFGFSGS